MNGFCYGAWCLVGTGLNDAIGSILVEDIPEVGTSQ